MDEGKLNYVFLLEDFPNQLTEKNKATSSNFSLLLIYIQVKLPPTITLFFGFLFIRKTTFLFNNFSKSVFGSTPLKDKMSLEKAEPNTT